ncbi:MAG TPA: TatD family hydrolase [Chitinophagaceae bacterium]|jgi:TatD DNase family protein|nr:TatD family hydrolase [Chitinophagaceae bacterium]
MNLIDTHCHIYSTEFDIDRTAMLSRADYEGITKMLMPAIDISTHVQMLSLENQFPGKCLSMMGLHPCSVKENYLEELAVVQQRFEKRSFVAVGETGLDFYWDLTYTRQQYEVFQRQIDLALQYDIPIVIHSRNSINECIELVEKNQKGKLKGIFHCFSGSIEQARKIIDLNFYLGIGGVLTFKKSGLDAVVDQLTLDHIVLETDAPYLAPVPFRGKRNECSYLKYVVEKLAEVKKVTVAEIAEKTTANAKELFKL